MKRYFWLLITLFAFFATACEQAPGLEKEKEAILAVLHEDSDAVIAKDFDRVKAIHVTDAQETRVELGIYGYNIYKGWEEVGGLLSDYIEGNPADEFAYRKENVEIKVTGNSAWLTCDNIWSVGSGE